MGDKAFSPAEARFLGHLQSQLSAVEALGLPPLICLLAIAQDEGLSVTELSERTGSPQQSVSRYVSMLLARYQLDVTTTPPPALIEQRINPADPRKRALYLSDGGRDVIRALLSISHSVAEAEKA